MVDAWRLTMRFGLKMSNLDRVWISWGTFLGCGWRKAGDGIGAGDVLGQWAGDAELGEVVSGPGERGTNVLAADD